MDPPVAFISYTHADANFTRPLYDELCVAGIRPILDERDFLLGDDLPAKIFNEGIGTADAVIVALSPDSAQSIWQNAEISAATVRAIRAKTRIIPIVLNDMDEDLIPIYLQTKIYYRIGPDSRIDDVARRIAQAVFCDRPNPTIGPPPAWTQRKISGVNGLSAIDEDLLVEVCSRFLGQVAGMVRSDEVLAVLRGRDVTERNAIASLSVLLSRHYLEQKAAPRGRPYPWAVNPTRFGLNQYLRVYRAEEYARARALTVSAMLALQQGNLSDLRAHASGAPDRLIKHIVEDLHAAGDAEMQVHSSGFNWLAKPSLERQAI